MLAYKYLIVGGGMSAAAAIKGIREIDTDCSIAVVGSETDPPYKRPPLSKKLWQGKPIEMVWKGMPSIGMQNLDLRLGRTITSVLPGERCVMDDAGQAYTYEKLLLATGGTPKRLPFGGDDIIYFRTLDDFRQLKALAETRQSFAVIGGGFIGAEIAASLAMNGKSVTIVVPGAGIGERLFPADLVRYLNSYYRRHGVRIVIGDKAADLERVGGELQLRLEHSDTLSVDAVIAGIGIEPNIALAESAGLQIDSRTGGIVVDEYLRTGVPDIYAAGDVASYQDCALGERRRVEHEDNANAMGKAAGRAMASAATGCDAEPYRHLPSFYSDMFDLGYEAVGEIDSSLETVADWKELYQEGVLYYLREGRVRGVLLWNTWGQVSAARRLISDPGPFRQADLKGRLPEPTQ
jgi:NADPH-dependent 2,4-dienoyl-CoA reductase/sulfur reductase-like enzyme